MKKLGIFILFMLLYIGKVDAYYCNYTDLANYKKIASNINYSYDYTMKGDTVEFNITLVNLSSEVYLKDNSGNTYYYVSDEINVTASSGENKVFYVYPTDSYCKNNYIYTIRIQLPTYNPYYKSELCTGIENYSLCQKWSTHNLTYEKFSSKIEEYKNSLKKDEEVIEKTKTFLDYFVEYLLKYYFILLIIIILGCSYGIYKINKKSDIYN